MPSALEKLAAEAMKLSPEERADLADRLWVSVEPKADVEAAWDEEIQRRIDDLEAGRTEAIPAEQVFAEIRARIKASRKR
jgi:putative addiction module component (TIGR02574 family)